MVFQFHTPTDELLMDPASGVLRDAEYRDTLLVTRFATLTFICVLALLFPRDRPLPVSYALKVRRSGLVALTDAMSPSDSV